MSILDHYALCGDNAADGDSVYLHCLRCSGESDLSIGKTVRRFKTDHFNLDAPLHLATLQDVWDAARQHDVQYHDNFGMASADTGEINVIRGRE